VQLGDDAMKEKTRGKILEMAEEIHEFPEKKYANARAGILYFSQKLLYCTP
jgi:hypothetical protein